MLKKYDGTNWNTVSYGKYFSGTEQFTNFPLVIRSLDQSVQAYTIKGNTSASGTPSPQNPVTIQGVGNETANLSTFEKGGLSTTDGSEISWSATYTQLRSQYIECEAESSYTVSLSKYPAQNFICFYDENKTYLSRTSGMSIVEPRTFTTPVNAKYFRVALSHSAEGQIYPSEETNLQVMVNTGSTPQSFEPFGFKISISSNGTALTPIYVSQPLYLYSTYADELSSSGAVTYNLDTLAFDGTENWQIFSSTTSFFYCTASRVLVTKSRLINSHGFEINAVSNGSAANQNLFRVYAINDFSTVEDFKQFLITQKAAGTPLTVLYIPATPTTESVTVPEITTTGGEVSIDVDTTVKPSEMSLTYNGKHLNKSKKYNGNNWT